jgi:hypothetical protein
MSHRIRVDGIEYNAGGFSHADNPHHVGEASQSGPGAMDRSASPIDVQRYLSPEFAQMEWDKMWTRVWLLVAHVAEKPAPPSYTPTGCEEGDRACQEWLDVQKPEEEDR